MMQSSSPCKSHAKSPLWLILVLVGTGTVMATLDASIVNVAMPVLTAAFKTAVSTSQWFILAYTFTVTISLMTCGTLGDILGRKRLYILGITLFMAASLGCGMSTSATMLIASRALQGLGSALMMAIGPAMLIECSPPDQRGRSMGVIGMTVALGLLAGPVVGGMVLQHTSWRWMFFINIPIGLALITLMLAKVNGFNSRSGHKLDLAGAILMATSLAAIVLGLTFGERLGWTSVSIISLICAGVVLAAIFVFVETRIENPMLDTALFGNRTFSIGAVTGWASYAAMMPLSVFLPFYLEGVLHYPMQKVGLTLACGPLTLAAIAPLAGMLSDRIGYKLLTVAGQAILAVAILSLRTLNPYSSLLDVVWRLSLAAFGSALFASPNTSAIMGSVKRKDLGIASGTVALVRNLGMVSGIAIAGAIITSISPSFTLGGFRAALLASAVISAAGAALSTMRVDVST